MVSSAQPTLLGRLVAHLHGEVAATALEAYHRAGRAVYALLDRLEQLDLEADLLERNPWKLPKPLQLAKLCGWNAFALQVVGDELLENEYRCHPLTVGFVDPLTAEQALSCYGQVSRWLTRGEQALHDTAYELDVAVPAPLPRWVEAEEFPDSHVSGLQAALGRLRRHAEAAVWDSRPDAWAVPPHDTYERARGRIEQLLAEAGAADDYADGLSAGGACEDPVVAKEVVDQVRTGLERYYLVGQLLAMPALSLEPLPRLQAASRRRPGRPAVRPRPGESGFDPWCLTDPRVVERFRRDRDARRAIDELWERDPDPTRTLAIKADIDGALYRHDIAYEVGHYYCCPWSPIYLVKQAVRIGPRALHPVEQFTYDVGVEARGRGWTVHREILIGPFYPAPE